MRVGAGRPFLHCGPARPSENLKRRSDRVRSVANTLADTVSELLLKGIGDRGMLEQVLRAAERHEPISLNEREYVEHLRSAYLDPVPKRRAKPAPPQPPAGQALAPPAPPRRRFGRKTLVLAGVVAALAAAGAYSALAGVNISPLSVGLDAESYRTGDIVAISGESAAAGQAVDVYLSDETGAVVWSEKVELLPDGSFSTLAISGGPGWAAGTYLVTVAHGGLVESAEFRFLG